MPENWLREAKDGWNPQAREIGFSAFGCLFVDAEHGFSGILQDTGDAVRLGVGWGRETTESTEITEKNSGLGLLCPCVIRMRWAGA